MVRIATILLKARELLGRSEKNSPHKPVQSEELFQKYNQAYFKVKYYAFLGLTLRRLMSYIYIYIYMYMEHPFLMFLDHTQRRSTVGRTPLDE